jgi:outer membrane protein assembly factor BamA
MGVKKPSFRRILFLLLALVIAPTIVSWAQAEPPPAQANPEPTLLTVTKITIQGNQRISAGEITAAVPFKPGTAIKEDDLTKAAKAIMDLGFFQDVRPDFRHLSDGVEVIFTVEENPVIKEITVKGNVNYAADVRYFGIPTPFTDYLVTEKRVKEILKDHEIDAGRVLNMVKLRQALGLSESQGGPCPLTAPPNGSLCKEYRDKGYFLVSLAGDIQAGSTLVIQIVEWALEGFEIHGLEIVPESVVLQTLSALNIGRPLKFETLQQGLQKLSSAVYFDPVNQEDISFAPGTTPQKVKLVLTLHERHLISQPVSIQKLDLVGNTLYPTGDLLTQIKLPDHPVNNYELLTLLQPIYQGYHDHGYMLMKFAEQDLQDGTLTLHVSEGVIGAIKIMQDGTLTDVITAAGVQPVAGATAESQGTSAAASGGLWNNLLGSLGLGSAQTVQSGSARAGGLLGLLGLTKTEHTRPQLILKELRLKPGAILNQYRLGDSYRNLMALGYFKTVNFDFETPAAGQPGDINLLVQIAEQDKLGNLNGSLTFNKDGLTGKLEVALKNLGGSGQDLALSFDRGLVGKAVLDWNLDYNAHSFFEDFSLVKLSLYNKNSQEGTDTPTTAHLLTQIGGEVSLGYPMGNGVELVLTLRHENFTKEFDEKPVHVERGVTDTAAVEVNHDTRNNPAFPTAGGFQSFQIEQAGGFTVGPKFTKLQATLLQFVPTWPDQTIAARLYSGLGLELPSQEHFSLGGATTLRGFDAVSTSNMALLNLEYRISFQDAVSLAIFTDIGTAAPWELKELKKSFGAEIRLTLPYIGLVRAGLVWPITERFDLRPHFEFGLGEIF